MAICVDVLHDSILGEKDEPITVINFLHIKASAEEAFLCSGLIPDRKEMEAIVGMLCVPTLLV